MSRKNEIDELFRNALGEKGLNYSPEYWEQMEALIAKRRRKFIKRTIWFCTGYTLLFVLALLFSLPQNEGSEERPPSPYENFGKDDDLRTATAGKREEKVDERDMVRHTERSRSTTDETEPAELPTNRSEKRTFGQSGGAEPLITLEGDEGISDFAETPDRVEGSRLQGRHPEQAYDSPEPNSRHPEQANGTPELVQSPRRVEGPRLVEGSQIINQKSELSTIPSLQPESLGDGLLMTQPISTPLSVENPKKLLRRRPSYTQWYLGSYMNYGWVKHRLDPSIHTWKTTNEKVRPFMHYGINIRASKRGFSLSIGTGIRQWTERTQYTRQIDHYTFDSSFRLVNRNFIKRPDGTYAALVQKQIDTTSHTTTTEFICQDCPVTFRYITVPLAVHYEFGLGKWLGFTEAGMTFSFLSKSTGEYSVEWQAKYGNTPGMRTDQLSGKYLSPMVLQAGLTAGISYRIHPFLSISGQFSYQRSLNSTMVLYRQESDFYGVGVGVEWKLF